MMSNTDSTTDDDCRFERPWLATAFTRSFFVTVGRHLPLETRPGKCAPQAVAGLGPRRPRCGYKSRCAPQAVAGLGSRRPRCGYKWKCAPQAVAGLGSRRPRRK